MVVKDALANRRRKINMKKHIRCSGYYLAIVLLALSLTLTACTPNTASVPATTTGPGISSSQNAIVNMPSFADLISMVQPCVVEIDVSATVRSWPSHCPAAGGRLRLDNECEWHDRDE